MKFERGILIDRDLLTDVYRGRQRSSGQTVALKGLREEFCTEASVPLFEREGGVGAQIHHPNVVRLLDVMREQGRPYLVLEALDGETLQTRLAQGALREDEAVDIVQQVAAGLAQAHRQGLAHCALQPSLILLCRDQTAKIMDFGLSEFTAQIARMYPEVQPDESAYLSPEQNRGEAGDARSDIYALGMIMTEMLAGAASSSAPLAASSSAPLAASESNTITQNGHRNPVPQSSSSTRLPQLLDSVSPRVRAIIQKALREESIARFASGGEMLLALQDLAWRDRDAVQEALKEVRQDAAPVLENTLPLVSDKEETPIREELKQSGGALLLGALFAVAHRSGTAPNDNSDATPAATPQATTKRPLVVAAKPHLEPPNAMSPVMPKTTEDVSAETSQTAPQPASGKSSSSVRAQTSQTLSDETAPVSEMVIKNPAPQRVRPIRRARRARRVDKGKGGDGV